MAHRAPSRRAGDPDWMACACQRLRQTTRRVTQLYEHHLAPVGLTSNQFSALATLHAMDGASMGALAEQLVTDPTTLTRTLGPLTAAGYVRLSEGGADRRRREVRLTPQGRAVFRRAVPLWRTAQQQLRAALGDGDFLKLYEALVGALDRLPAAA
ncbi:MAG: winged helix-turn-helix transcriptional regulator [Proteobacteria bacterium]|nr:winged helix-turn-helix transcriptional regulator [Pseudomonadota bacterium]